MISFWSKELSLTEITELVTEYYPHDHSAYEDSALHVWPLGEDLISSNVTGSIIHDMKSNVHGSSYNMDSSNFVTIDLSAFNALTTASYPTLTSTILNATDATPIASATVKLIGAEATFTATTDTSGTFTFSDVPAKAYTLEVSASGFVTYTTSFNAEATNSISLSPLTEESESGNFRFILSWNELPTDMDIHCFIHDDSGNLIDSINYANTSYSNGEFTVNLDNDERSGYGPETITVNALPENYTLRLFVINFSGDETTLNSNASLSVYEGNTSLGQFNVSDVSNPENSNYFWWHVATYSDSNLNAIQTFKSTP